MRIKKKVAWTTKPLVQGEYPLVVQPLKKNYVCLPLFIMRFNSTIEIYKNKRAKDLYQLGNETHILSARMVKRAESGRTVLYQVLKLYPNFIRLIRQRKRKKTYLKTCVGVRTFDMSTKVFCLHLPLLSLFYTISLQFRSW